MTKKKIMALTGGIVVLVLLVVGSGLGAYVHAQDGKEAPDGGIEEQQAGAIACPDSVTCSRTDQVVKVVNTGTGHGILGKTTSSKTTKAGVIGNATKKARGVYGKSKDGPGVYGTSTGGYGGHFYSANDDAVYADTINGHGVHVDTGGINGFHVNGANFNGLKVDYAGTNGVWIKEADNHGVYIQDAASDGVKVWNATGDGFDVKTAGGDGLHVASATDDGVHIQNATDDGVYIHDVEGVGVYVRHSDGNGVYVESVNAGMWGGSFKGGVYAERGSGNIIEARSGITLRFRVHNDGNVTADGNFTGGGADFADMSPAVSGLEAADVLVIGPDGKLALSSQPYSTAVAGVYSTKPGFVGGQADDGDTTGKVPLAIVGIVPVKASAENGTICPGDLLATSSTPGHAMKATDVKTGTIIGKAMESLESGMGIIKMLVTLQ